jgi:hypothetical protein
MSLVALFLFVHSLISATGAAAAPQRASITAKWREDLRAAVGSVPLGLVVGHGHETKLQPKTSLWFLDNNTIVATFVTREDKTTLSRRDSLDENLPLRLRAVFLDVGTGSITATSAWPTESRFAGIVATNNGKFVTQRGTALTLYSRDAQELEKLRLPPVQEDLSGWFAHPSPTGRSILFATSDLTTTSATPWIWVDTNSLQIVRSWKETQSGWVGISDNTIAMTACIIWNYHCDPKVEVRGLAAAEWKTIAPIENHDHPYPQFVNEEILVLPGKHTEVLGTDGKTVFASEKSTGGCELWISATSSGGKRFVIPSCHVEGQVLALDIEGRDVLKQLLVYDASSNWKPYALDVRGPKIKGRMQVALSPDGSLLAILNDGWVHLFQLPSPPPLPAGGPGF